jgi:TRL-like protein family
MSFAKLGVVAVLTTAVLSSCSLTLPVAATGNAVGSKVGTASATGFLSVLFFGGDASIRTAAKNGGISKISTVDLKQTNVLGLVSTFECIVTGE